MSNYETTPAGFRRYVAEETASPPEELARTERLGKEWDFSGLVPSLKAIFDLLRQLASSDLEHLPRDRFRSLTPITQEFSRILEEVQNFSSVPSNDNPDPQETRKKLLSRAESAEKQVFDSISPLVAYLAARRNDRSDLTEVRQKTIDELNSLIQTAKERAAAVSSAGEQVLKEATGIRDTLRSASADVGVSEHSDLFRSEADGHKKSSRFWLRMTAWLAGAALSLSVVGVVHSLCTSVPFPESVPGIVSKLALLAVVYYAVIWSGRTYRSERHNTVINQHRHNALRTFETFVAASGDDATRNAVLLRATESIFAHQPSGFSDKSQEPGNPTIFEVFRNLSSGPQE